MNVDRQTIILIRMYAHMCVYICLSVCFYVSYAGLSIQFGGEKEAVNNSVSHVKWELEMEVQQKESSFTKSTGPVSSSLAASSTQPFGSTLWCERPLQCQAPSPGHYTQAQSKKKERQVFPRPLKITS